MRHFSLKHICILFLGMGVIVAFAAFGWFLADNSHAIQAMITSDSYNNELNLK